MGVYKWTIKDRDSGDEWDVEVNVELARILESVARDATFNRSGRSQLLSGRIKAKVVRYRHGGAGPAKPVRNRGVGR